QAWGQALPLKAASVDCGVAAWVLGYLGRRAVADLLGEVDRVLAPGPGSGIWAIENGGGGEFQTLRGFQGLEPAACRLIEAFGFQVVEEIPLRLVFPSAAEAERILGALCGDAVRAVLAKAPRAELSHRAVLLFRPS
ncbi:MAG TPA: class I SAM-dependent methyltransferase, partial [Holophagaceae bacterium]|nr:class I SAM-dependent methyltransferase [Holophagaceae bacterium]